MVKANSEQETEDKMIKNLFRFHVHLVSVTLQRICNSCLIMSQEMVIKTRAKRVKNGTRVVVSEDGSTELAEQEKLCNNWRTDMKRWKRDAE